MPPSPWSPPECAFCSTRGPLPPLRHHLPGHEIETAYELGWSMLNNGELLTQAEAHGFQAFVTTDRNLRYQQRLSERRIAILVLSTTSWPRIRTALPSISEAVSRLDPGSYAELVIP